MSWCLVVSNPDVEMEVTHEEEKLKDAPLVSQFASCLQSYTPHFMYDPFKYTQ